MKVFLVTIMLSIITTTSHAMENLELAYEAESIQAEFYDTSNTGQIRAINCLRCPDSVMKFEQNVKFQYEGKDISLEEFLRRHKSEKFFTIFFDISTNKLSRISF